MSEDAKDHATALPGPYSMLAMMGNPAPLSAPPRPKPDKPTARRKPSATASANGQILFKVPSQPKPRKPPKRTVEAPVPDIYDVVLDMRRAGMTVYRQGAHHQVDGRTLDDAELRLLWKEFQRAVAAG
jgi:hypothetical protein